MDGHDLVSMQLPEQRCTICSQLLTRGKVIKPLFIIHGLKGGGAERVLLTLLRHLDRSTFQPTLFLLEREGVYWNEVPGHVRVAWGLEGGKVRDAPLRVIGKLVREAREHDVIIGALTFTPTYLAWLVGRLAGRPVVGWVHNDLLQQVVRLPRWHRFTSRIVYSRLRRLVFVSRGAMDSAASWLGRAPGPEWRTIYNPFDSTSYSLSKTESTESGRRQQPGVPTVISVGRLVEQKGFDTLIRAHARLLLNGVANRLLIVGEGEKRRELEGLAEKLGVRETVSLPGFVNDPLSYLRSSAVFALSSRWEGFSMATLEALAAGLPIVATDCPSGPSEILDGGRYGLLVPVDNEIALADALKWLLEDRELRARLSSEGLIRARDFGPEKAAEEWASLLSSVCTQPGHVEQS